MKLPFLDRTGEAARFRRLLARTEGSLGVVYGRRRCGKSRLLREILPAGAGGLLRGRRPRRHPPALGPGDRGLGAGQVAAVEEEIGQRMGHHVGGIWEELARASAPLLRPGGRVWGPASRWWGPGLDRRPLEVDLVAESPDRQSLLVGEVKWAAPRDAGRLLDELADKARRLPLAAGKDVVPAVSIA